MENIELVNYAKQAEELAYSHYSDFKVGAALLTKSGEVYTGCNIENASFGATICAERVAIFKAVSEGKRDFDAIAITSSGAGTAFPCGICLQVMAEFAPEMSVILCDNSKKISIYKLKELLPHGFKL